MKKVLAILLLSILLIGCDGRIEPIEVVVPSALPTETARVMPTAIASFSPVPTPEATPEPSYTPEPTVQPTPSDTLMAYIHNMTIEERIGQLCMFGFSGTNSVSSTFASIMEEYKIGGVILYGQNISRTDSDGGFSRCASLTADICDRNPSEIPLLISTDVEGGNVTRFKWPSWPTHARTLGNRNDEDGAFEQFLMIGDGLAGVGINTDLAPCLDVAENPDSTFLKKRIISSDENIVSNIGLACIFGLQASGTLSIVKHFPGHGATSEDSHETTPVVYKTLDELRAYELVPFMAAADAGVDGVMVGHILYPEVDSEIATLSYVWITEILREEMGFDGIVMSDDFRMSGLRSRATLSDAAVQFILAGGDLILCGANHDYQRQILEGLYAAVDGGIISEERLNESVYRILSAKTVACGWNY
ncbi:MAG: glycoside hydrolase family 3 N-terminal domain-containing protein [Clostridia bacterium]|nr:glycoside hydrolase family 3 N-terminal domain-containing protein [Clostridia bacterium]